MRQKIAYFIPTLKLAGTSTQAIAFCEAAHAAGYAVDLIVATKRGVFLDAAAAKGFNIDYIPARKYFARLFNILYIARYILQQKPELFISGAKGVNKQAIWAHILSFKRSQLVLILTNELLQRKSETERGRIISKAIHLWLYKFADKVVVLTSAMQDVFIKAGYSRGAVPVIAPPINIPQIKQKALEPLDHPWLLQPKSHRDVPVILAVGRVHVQKNYPELIEAFAIAQETRPLRLIIIGTGTDGYTSDMKALTAKHGLSDKVDFAGFSANPYQYMHHANILALSSHWEGFGIVVSEAMACGLTVASTDCPDGPSEILGQGEFGYLAKPYAPNDLARAMLAAIYSPVNPKKLEAEAAQYDGPLITEKYQALIREPSA